MDYIHKSSVKKRRKRDLREKDTEKTQNILGQVSFFTGLTDSFIAVDQGTLKTVHNFAINLNSVLEKSKI